MNNDQLMIGQSAQNNIQLNKAIEEAEPCKCECGSIVFIGGYIMKKVPGIYVGKPGEQLCPIPVYVCAKCGTILKEMADNEKFARMTHLPIEQKTTPILAN